MEFNCKRFQSGVVKRIVEEILTKHLTKVKYNGETAPELSKIISNEILTAVTSNHIIFKTF